MAKKNQKCECLECGHKDYDNPLEPCKPGYACYIDAPEYFNCFMVYKYYIDHPHTLQETAKFMSMSHTTVKCIEDAAVKKLKAMLKSGELGKDMQILALQED